MKAKKESKTDDKKAADPVDEFVDIKSKAQLKSFLQTVRERMSDEQAAPLYAMSAMNYVMNLPDFATLLDGETKEIARDIWLRIKQAGLQLRNPPILFAEDEDTVIGANR